MLYGIIEAGDERYVKIGTTWGHQDDRAALAKRVSTLQTGSPRELTCVAVAPGYRDEERALHRRFSGYHVRGEWFARAGLVVEWLEQWRIGSGAVDLPITRRRAARTATPRTGRWSWRGVERSHVTAARRPAEWSWRGKVRPMISSPAYWGKTRGIVG